MPLALSRDVGQSIIIDNIIKIEVVKVDRGQVKLAITAPEGMAIYREEIMFKNDFAGKDYKKKC